MSVLVLHRNPLEPWPYQRWLADIDRPVVVLAARDRLAPFGEQVPSGNLGYHHLEFLDTFADEELVTKRTRELIAEFRVTHLLADHEADLIPVARLRVEYGIPGAAPGDLLPFRDKLLAKSLAQRAGIEVAPHILARTAPECRAFAQRHGLPLVAKDRAGYNSIGLRILRSEAEFEDFLATAHADGPREDLLLERFVPGRMCHVDGLVVDGRTVAAWPSQYQYDLASFGSDTGVRVDLTLDPDDPLTDRLLELADRILAALRPPETRLRDHGFHAEIFHTPDDRLVLCEMAARTGGAKIREVFGTLFGFNLGEYAMRAQVGLPLPALPATVDGARPVPGMMSGQALMMKRPGLVRSVPSRPAEPWVRGFWVYARPGQVIPPASGSADFLTAVVGSAPTRAECERRLRALGERLTAQTEIVPAESVEAEIAPTEIVPVESVEAEIAPTESVPVESVEAR